MSNGNPTFQGQVHQNKYLPEGANKVDSILSVTSILPAGGVTVTGSGRVIGFLVDKSGSMGSNNKWNNARKAVAEAIMTLPEDAEFFVVVGGDTGEVLIPLQKATAANKAKAAQIVGSHGLGGGTYFARWLSVVNDIFAQRPQAIRVLIFLTDGENDGDDTTYKLPAVLQKASGLYQTENRGVGDGYRPDQLRAIQQVLGGTVGGMQNAAELAKDFAAIVEKTKGLAMASVQVQFWTPVGAKIAMVKQVSPEILDLTAKVAATGNPRIQRIDTGSWGEETREYHVQVELEPGSVGTVGGPEKLCARVSLVYSDNGTETEIKLNEGGQVKAEWTEDDKRSAVINPKVANYTGQAELAAKIQEGVKALNDGDEEKATKALQRAVELADQTGNDGTKRLLAKVVDVDDKGTVKLKKGASKGDMVDLDTQSTLTKRVK
jgi:hypothetical protein